MYARDTPSTLPHPISIFQFFNLSMLSWAGGGECRPGRPSCRRRAANGCSLFMIVLCLSLLFCVGFPREGETVPLSLSVPRPPPTFPLHTKKDVPHHHEAHPYSILCIQHLGVFKELIDSHQQGTLPSYLHVSQLIIIDFLHFDYGFLSTSP